MKIIHTADWHLGKLLCGVYLHDDQRFILEEFFQLLDREKPDLILLAGDIYDRSYPPVEAVRLLNTCFEKIILDLKIPMVLIRGNHDHPDRLDFASGLMEKSGLYLRAKLEKEVKPISFTDPYGQWEIYPIPYADPAMVRAIYEDEDIRNSQVAMDKILEPINQKIRLEKREAAQKGHPPKRYIALAHSFFIGGQGPGQKPEESDSERPLSVGGVDYIKAEVWQEFDYVALGHLHKAQKIDRDSIRYAGSLLKYSFSEVNQPKSLVILDWQKDLSIRLEHLKPRRDLRIVKGTLAQILDQGRQDPNRQDYIMARLTNPEILIDPISDLRGVYPNILALEYDKKTNPISAQVKQVARDRKNKNIWDLFAEFYEATTGDQPALEDLKHYKFSQGASRYEAD